MRICRRIVKILLLLVVLSVSTLVGGVWFAYWYLTDGETVAKLIREQGIRYFPHSVLKPGRVDVQALRGELVFRQLQLIQRVDGAQFETLYLPWLNVKINLRKLFELLVKLDDSLLQPLFK